MPRRADPRRIKCHLVYTAAEAAEALGVHKGTVRRWIVTDGLPTTTDRKPSLIDGGDLKRFLEARKRAAKRPLSPGEFYCLRCRDRRHPDGGLVDYRPRTPVVGMLCGLCPVCAGEMFRTTRKADLRRLPGNFEVAFPMAKTGITGSASPILNVDFGEEPETHGKTLR